MALPPCIGSKEARECSRCEGYGDVSEMAPCTTFGPDCGCHERVVVTCPTCDGFGTVTPASDAQQGGDS